jgi:hypothetical protein
LIWFVLFILLTWFIWLVSFNQKPDKPNRPNKPNNSLLSLADFQVWLCDEMVGEEHVLKSVSAKDDLVASGELVDDMEDLIPGVLRHEADERFQTDDGLLIEMVENGCRESIAMGMLPLYRMNIRI